MVKRIEYDSFGNIINDTDPSFEVPFRFAGGLYDKDTGLVRFGFRDYDPDIGRWTAKDPIGFSGGSVDLYGYCLNSPVKFNDPWGLSTATYDRATRILRVVDRNGNLIGEYEAGNMTTNPTGDPYTVNSFGPAPAGTFPVQPPINTDGLPEFGPYFWPIGAVGPNRGRLDIARQRGIGIHSGRSGSQSRTQGCIRISDEDSACLYEATQDDPLTKITIMGR